MGDYLWKSLLTEFLGTFVLVFVGAGTVALTASQGGSLIASAFAFGLVLMVLFYSWGSYSGAHFNPAVSFGFALSGRMNWLLMLGYWIAQLLGGIVAGALIAYLFGTGNNAGASVGQFTNTDAWKAVFFEAILTFFLVVTVLLVTANPMLAVVSGLAIGLVLTFDMFVGFWATGASMNPARSLGPAIFGNQMGTYWIYIVGPLLGAIVAALIFKLFDINWSAKTLRNDCGEKILDECGNEQECVEVEVRDKCGKVVKDCNGSVKEKIIRPKRHLTHMQETPLSWANEWMSEHKMNPQYLMDKARKSMASVGAAMSAPAAPVAPMTPARSTVLPPPSPRALQTPFASSMAAPLSTVRPLSVQ